jgi:hypothetical protein
MAAKALCYLMVTFMFLVSTVAKPQPPSFDQNHSDFTQLLKSVVEIKGATSEVNYKKLKKEPVLFNKYLKTISKVSEATFNSFSEQEQIAFLINAYNAFTLKLIVDNYPVISIKKIGGLFSSPWKMKFIRLLGKDRSLDEIEHSWLRKKYKEPRVHFAVNCASIGCPALRAEAYVATQLNAQLDEQAKFFLRDGVRNQIDIRNKKLNLSKIFDWFKEDFESTGGVQKFVSTIITDDPTVREALATSTYSLSFTDYDWNLNDLK